MPETNGTHVTFCQWAWSRRSQGNVAAMMAATTTQLRIRRRLVVEIDVTRPTTADHLAITDL